MNAPTASLTCSHVKLRNGERGSRPLIKTNSASTPIAKPSRGISVAVGNSPRLHTVALTSPVNV